MDSLMGGGGMRMNRQSTLDTLLEKDNVTLEEVLNDSEILTEIKWGNARLTNLYVFLLILTFLLSFNHDRIH
jgi:hypothetical protein